MAGGNLWTDEEDHLVRNYSPYEKYVIAGGTRTASAYAKRRSFLNAVASGESARESIENPVAMIPTPDTDDMAAWSRYFDLLKEAAKEYQSVTNTSRIISVSLPGELPVGICFVGDTHLGNVGVRYDLLERDLELLAGTEGLYGVLMGDIIDNFKPVGKAASGMFGEMAGPQAQLHWALNELLLPSGKWLALLEGNHDGWDYRSAGISRLPDFAEKLGTPYVSQAGCSMHITVGTQRYVLYAKHDWRGTSALNKGNAARNMYDQWPWDRERADLIALAHTHEPHAEIPMRNGLPVTYLRGGTYKTMDGYAEDKGFRPEWGVPMVILFPMHRCILTFQGTQFLEAVETLKLWRSHLSPSSAQ